MFTVSIKTTATIAASPEEVIALLTNAEDYTWNTFLKKFEVTGGPTGAGGAVVEGSTLAVEMEPEADGKRMKFDPVVAVKTPTELRWVGVLGLPAVFRGEHYFIATPGDAPGETLLTHGEDFSGAIIPIFKMFGLDSTLKGFEAMNAGVKEHFATQ